MNVRVHGAVCDIEGATRRAILRALAEGRAGPQETRAIARRPSRQKRGGNRRRQLAAGSLVQLATGLEDGRRIQERIAA